MMHLATCAALIAMPATADPLYGLWCNDDVAVSFDEYGMGINEHTMCDTAIAPRSLNGRYDSEIGCRSVYVIGDVLEAGAAPLTTHVTPLPEISRVSFRILSDSTAAARLSHRDETYILQRCD